MHVTAEIVELHATVAKLEGKVAILTAVVRVFVTLVRVPGSLSPRAVQRTRASHRLSARNCAAPASHPPEEPRLRLVERRS